MNVKREVVLKRGVKRIYAGSRVFSTEQVRKLKLILETCLMSVSGHKGYGRPWVGQKAARRRYILWSGGRRKELVKKRRLR